MDRLPEGVAFVPTHLETSASGVFDPTPVMVYKNGIYTRDGERWFFRRGGVWYIDAGEEGKRLTARPPLRKINESNDWP